MHPVLAGHTGFLLSRVGGKARRRFAARLADVGLNFRMWGALSVLDAEGPITQQALGRCVGIDPSSMVATIDALEAAGLVERRPHPSDRRAHALAITPAGRATLADGRRLAADAQEELLSLLSAEERGQLHQTLLKLATA